MSPEILLQLGVLVIIIVSAISIATLSALVLDCVAARTFSRAIREDNPMCTVNTEDPGLKVLLEEHEFLKWYYENADFGPAHEDVVATLHDAYNMATGNPVPDAFIEEV